MELFYFYLIFLLVCELFFFCCCLVSVDFLLSFLLYFTLFFVNFWGLSLPCHLLYCSLLFVFLFFFFSWIFCFFCKFNCPWHFSSGHVLPWGLVAQCLRFEDGYRRVVSYTIVDLGKRAA